MRQGFVLAEDLFYYDVERACAARRPAHATDQLPQSARVLRRVAQAVDMVKAQSLQAAFGNQACDQAVDRAKCRRVFHPQPGEVVDVEKAAIVHRGKGDAPVSEPVMLALQQPVQQGRPGFVIAAKGRQTMFDDFGGAGNFRKTTFERWRVAIRWCRRVVVVFG